MCLEDTKNLQVSAWRPDDWDSPVCWGSTEGSMGSAKLHNFPVFEALKDSGIRHDPE